MLALCSILLATYYAPNYAGILGAGLLTRRSHGERHVKLKVPQNLNTAKV